MKDVTEHSLLCQVEALVAAELAPLAADIDQKGLYPVDFLRRLGRLGGYAAAVPQEQGGLARGLACQIEIGSLLGASCGATAFVGWCQTVSAWYLSRTPNEAVRQRHLQAVAWGEQLCGTGMSNTVKHLAGIERMLLKARRDGDRYVVQGVLPWVSNIAPGHLLAVAAEMEDGSGHVMFVFQAGAEQTSLHDCPDFSGMEGTATVNIRLNGLVVTPDQVLAHPEQFSAYMNDIKPGFVLSQTAMGLGVVRASLATIVQTNRTHAHVNDFLEDGEAELTVELKAMTQRIHQLAAQVDAGKVSLLEVLKARAWTSELALRAANSAALHAGARGYQMRHAAQRQLREAMFVAIVTPALKHLRREIHALQESAAQAEAI